MDKPTPNPFRRPAMRGAFDDMVKAYRAKSSLLFLANGEPHRGNSWAGMFWRGYEGTSVGVWDRESKETMSYPAWLAGKVIRENER